MTNRLTVLLLVIVLAVVNWIHEPAADGSTSDTEVSFSDTGETSGGHSVAAQGVTKKGAAFVMTSDERGLPGTVMDRQGKRRGVTPLTEFTMSLTEERR